MQKLNLPTILNNAKVATMKHSPEILTGIGIAGMVTTTIMAVRVTPKAITLVEDERKRLQAEEENDILEPIDVIKITWKCYIPAGITCAVSVACLIGASSVNARRNAALATAYTLSESTLRDYQKKVIETIGEKERADSQRRGCQRTYREKIPWRIERLLSLEKGIRYALTLYPDDILNLIWRLSKKQRMSWMPD